MQRSVKLAAAAILASFIASPAAAQMVCGERVEIVKALESGHQEKKTAAGLSGNGGLVELYTAMTGTWTLLLTLPGGPTCLLGSGEEWEGWKPKFDPQGQHSSTPGAVPADWT